MKWGDVKIFFRERESIKEVNRAVSFAGQDKSCTTKL